LLREIDMSQYSVAEAKNKLPSLINKALEGEEVIITRHGKPVVELRPAAPNPKPPIGSHAWLDERRRSRPRINISAVDLLNLIYEADEE
jgi:prevent-host-death family protein